MNKNPITRRRTASVGDCYKKSNTLPENPLKAQYLVDVEYAWNEVQVFPSQLWLHSWARKLIVSCTTGTTAGKVCFLYVTNLTLLKRKVMTSYYGTIKLVETFKKCP